MLSSASSAAAAGGAAAAPSLGTAQSYAVVAGSAVTNTGPTTISGDLGLSPGSSVTGFPPGQFLTGAIHAADAAALSAQTSVTQAYNSLAGEPCTQTLTGQDLGGLTLTPGVYCFATSAQLTGTLTLDGQGNPAALFIFKTGSTLTTASGSSVSLIGGASPCNVFWQVGSSSTLGTGSTFAGNILALTSITVTTGTTLNGRALARNGAVTLDASSITAPCAVVTPTCPTIALTPATAPNGTLGVAYSQLIAASGGAGPYSFSVAAGALPAGLTLSPAGVLSGTPTSAGSSTFTLRGTDAGGCFAESASTMLIATAVPTLPQVFVLLLAGTLMALGYLRVRRRLGH
ncbi:MAG: ice-binding family protein [Vicinamibacterales bacterium]